MNKQNNETATIHVKPLMQGTVRLRIIGTTPLFQNRMSEKVIQMLLVGGKKKTASERSDIKHFVLEEFRNSAEILPSGPTALGLKCGAVKNAMATAALETDGITKTSMQRLLTLPNEFSELYGTPQLRMDVVRCADIGRTPDIRTRAFLPRWCAEIEMKYVVPQLNLTSVVSLLCNAGILIGVGDYRQEKGKGNFGSFRVVGQGEKDAEWDELVKNHGRKAQIAALESPEFANAETEDLFQFYLSEVERRANTQVVSATAKKNGKAAPRELAAV